MCKAENRRKAVIIERRVKMYGTTMKSFNMSSTTGIKTKKSAPIVQDTSKKKLSKRELRKNQDTRYININENVEQTSSVNVEENVSSGFSLRELPIAQVVITVVLTMMILVMMSGFGGI